MWVLVLVYLWQAPAMAVVPGNYSTEEKCEAAGKVARNKGLIGSPIVAYCIPAPDDIGYE